jgi:tetratricopeptide (TPR) repeat protein
VRQGRLQETPLPRLLLELAAAGHTGELAVARGRERARVAWLAGMPVACDLEPPGPGLLELLVERGRLAQADAERARATRAARGCADEAALLGLGLVAARDLLLARREVVARRMVALGRFESGDFQVAMGEAPPPGSELLRVDPLPVVQRMLTAHWRPDRMLSDLEAKLRLHPSVSAEGAAVAARVEGGLASGLDGTRTAWSLVATMADAQSIAALWVLDASGALVWSEEPAPAPAAEGEADAATAAPAATAGPEIEIEVVGARARAPVGAAAPAGAAASRGRAPGAADARASGLRAEIEEKRSRLAELDHYALLDIEPGVGAAEVKRAYLKAAKRFHPDALSRLGLEGLKREANELFAAITRAHETLSDAERRREYDAALAGHVQVDADRLAQAESLYRKAEMLMRAGQFGPAVDLAQGAVALWPEDPAYQGALGWCLYKRQPPDEERAAEHLGKALALDPRDAVNHLRLGIVLKARGDAAGAARATARGKQLDPKARA